MRDYPTPRPARCYDPTVAPHRADGAVHVHDHATIRTLLRDVNRTTADVSGMLPPEQQDRLHPVAAFVWATDRRTVGGCPGRHATLRAAMAPWFTAADATARARAARASCEQLVPEAGLPFDVYGGYALPLAVGYVAGWLGIGPAEVRYAVDDQLAAGELFDSWPPLAPPGMAEFYGQLMARPQLGGVAGAARELVRSGVITEREAWGIVYSISVTSVATAASITLAVGLSVDHGLWPRMADHATATAAIEESVRLGNPFPLASRFVREPFRLGAVEVAPGDQVVMWLTAANRGLPGPHPTPLDRFDPWRDTAGHLGWGSGYHRCAGRNHARAFAAVAVTTLAGRRPELEPTGPWERLVGIDDGFSAAPAVAAG